MKRVVIIEGPDNIGKSYLAESLSHTVSSKPITVRHIGAPVRQGRTVLREQLTTLRNEMEAIDTGDGIDICDRSVIGEDVYGPLYRRGQYDHAEYHVEMSYEVKKRERQIFLIVLYTDGEMFKRLKIKSKADETKTYQRQEEAAKIAMKFVDVATSLRLKNTLFVNCANYETLDERNNYISRRVRAWLELKRYRYEMAEDYTQTFFNAKDRLWKPTVGFVTRPYECHAYESGKCGIGRDHKTISEFGKDHDQPTSACGATRKVDYIFVGEAPGQKGCGKLGIPFFGDMSGNLLQEALDSCSVLPTRYYMTNVVKCCPKENNVHAYGEIQELVCASKLSSEITAIKKKNDDARVIAIGKVAAFELARAGVQHEMLYHPAYYLRTGTRDNFIVDFKKVVQG